VICQLSEFISCCCKIRFFVHISSFFVHISSSGLLIQVLVLGHQGGHVLGYGVPGGYVFPGRGRGWVKSIPETGDGDGERDNLAVLGMRMFS